MGRYLEVRHHPQVGAQPDRMSFTIAPGGVAKAFSTETTMGPAREPGTPSSASEIATLGGGCFWCLEAVFEQLRGVERVVSGYCGGTLPNPSYAQVCGGATGHAEVVQVTFDPAVVSF